MFDVRYPGSEIKLMATFLHIYMITYITQPFFLIDRLPLSASFNKFTFYFATKKSHCRLLKHLNVIFHSTWSGSFDPLIQMCAMHTRSIFNPSAAFDPTTTLSVVGHRL